MRKFLAPLTLLALTACAAPLTNPSFPVTISEARHDLQRMREDPVPPARPIVVIGGYADPGLASARLSNKLRKVLGPDAVVVSSDVAFCFSMDSARQRLLRHVEAALALASPDSTVPVDVVAVSMGGLVARYAAAPIEGSPRLNIVRLFTIASPHRGASLASIPTWESRVCDMRTGSAFLASLDAQPCNFEIVPYARLGDSIVGEANTAPQDLSPWWVDTPPFEPAHLQAHSDPRILADIARALRGEEPFRRSPRRRCRSPDPPWHRPPGRCSD